MPDPRNARLAKQITTYSLKVKPGELVYIDIYGVDCLELGEELVNAVTEAKGVPFFQYNGKEILRAFWENATEAQCEAYGTFHKSIMERVAAYVAVRGDRNPYEYSGLTQAQNKAMGQKYYSPVHIQTRLKKKWVVLRYPNETMAAFAQKPTRAFQDYYYDVCLLDYARMAETALPLKHLMEKTDKVRITGPGTDLSFSIKDIPVIPCDGVLNIPDGETFTAPVRTSMNGVIQYNTRTQYQSTLFNNIRFVIENGRIMEATCEGDSRRLNQILDADEGARYFGEWSIGYNPHVMEPILDTLFDEKIWGSFHLTPGNAYDEADNGNRSEVHWDLVCIQRPEYGGGEIWFDGVLIRKDGEFTVSELKGMTRENLTR